MSNEEKYYDVILKCQNAWNAWNAGMQCRYARMPNAGMPGMPSVGAKNAECTMPGMLASWNAVGGGNDVAQVALILYTGPA